MRGVNMEEKNNVVSVKEDETTNTHPETENKETQIHKGNNNKKVFLVIACCVVALILFWTISMRVNVPGRWVRENTLYSAKYGCYTNNVEGFTKEGKIYVSLLFNGTTNQLLSAQYGTWEYSLLKVVEHKDGNKNSTCDLWYIPIINKLINNSEYVLRKME